MMHIPMSSDLLAWIDAWQSLTVLVIGDAILDSYLNGSTERLCRDAPAPVVAIHQRQDVPGGAANTAANVASLDGKVSLLSVIGSDREGERLRFALEQRGVSTVDLLTHKDRETLAKQRVVAGAQILVRLDQGSTEPISPELEQQLINRLTERFPSTDAVIVSDYGYGILTSRLIETLAELQLRYPRTLVVDARQLMNYRKVGATAVKPNYDEAIQLLGLPKQHHERAEQVASHGQVLLTLTGATIAAVTLDTEGAILFEAETTVRTYARPAPSNQTNCGGDCCNGNRHRRSTARNYNL
jgi:D-beta-D-heptose 7-phosphate kinase / D-beta-D-heptose 1-phosphate adenosyltransferase